jgi:TolA-binding protein
VRAEERELEGQDLERDARTQGAVERERDKSEELPDYAGEVAVDLELDHRSRLFEAVRLVLAEEHLSIELLYLPQRETHALIALKSAVDGRDHVGEFVFAEDRKALLEQSLAVLQQNITHSDPAQLAELQSKFGELHERVAELRDRLTSLEDAQEDILEERNRMLEEEAAGGGDSGDDDSASEATDTAATDGSLYEPERPVPPRAPSSLAGPDLPAQPPRPSSLAGPDLPAQPPRPSSLAGPDRSDEPTASAAEAAPAGTETGARSGPDAEPGPAAAVEPGASDAPKKKPWWRKPFG